jgi:hypothetical protein
MKAKIKVDIDLYTDTDDLVYSEPITDMYIGKPNLLAHRVDTILIPAAAADTEYTFPGDGVEILYILTNNDISIKLNANTNDAFAIKADRISPTEAKYGVYLATTSNITALFFSNSGQESATIKIIGFSL